MRFFQLNRLLLVALTAAPCVDAVAAPDTEPYAWQRTDKYVPPDFEAFFPDDPEAGERLDKFMHHRGWKGATDERVLRVVRQGLRRSKYHRSSSVKLLAELYPWGGKNANAAAIEILYHTLDPANDRCGRHEAINYCFGGMGYTYPNITRALVGLCLKGPRGVAVRRIVWGHQYRVAEFRSAIRLYLEGDDPELRERAEALLRHIDGGQDYQEWRKQRDIEKLKAELAEELPVMKEQLVNGDSAARWAVMRRVGGNYDILQAMDDSFIDAWVACGSDPKPDVRAYAARYAGPRWLSGETQSQRVIDMILRLVEDEKEQVREWAFDCGIKRIWAKNEAAMKLLVKNVMENPAFEWWQDSVVDALRAAWHKGPNREVIDTLLMEYLDRHEEEPDAAVRAYIVYEEVAGKPPPKAERFRDVGLFLLSVKIWGQAGMRREALLEQFNASVPEWVRFGWIREALVEHEDGYIRKGGMVVKGLAARRAVIEMLHRHNRLAFEMSMAVPDMEKLLKKTNPRMRDQFRQQMESVLKALEESGSRSEQPKEVF